MTLLRSIGRYTIYFAAFCLVINQLGFGSALSSIVTAAGVGALIISLGAQSIIKDVIAGAFIIFERQYAVGDFVKINEHEGTVLSLAMRCTYLKNWKGQKIIIPNGSISTVINYSGDFNMAIVDVPVAYEEDHDHVYKVLKEVADQYYDENKEICYEEPSVLGINSFDDSSIGYTVIMKAVKRNHFKIQRDLRVLIKKRFDEEGISIPFSQVVVHQAEKEA
jgi:small conductance mechanosensitive channel